MVNQIASKVKTRMGQWEPQVPKERGSLRWQERGNLQWAARRRQGDFFCKGIAGDWRNHFDEEAKRLFKEKAVEFFVQEG